MTPSPEQFFLPVSMRNWQRLQRMLNGGERRVDASRRRKTSAALKIRRRRRIKHEGGYSFTGLITPIAKAGDQHITWDAAQPAEMFDDITKLLSDMRQRVEATS